VVKEAEGGDCVCQQGPLNGRCSVHVKPRDLSSQPKFGMTTQLQVAGNNSICQPAFCQEGGLVCSLIARTAETTPVCERAAALTTI
jgi:hypothetical protein